MKIYTKIKGSCYFIFLQFGRRVFNEVLMCTIKFYKPLKLKEM